MGTPTLAPPGWYTDDSRGGEPRFWDGYQFPDEQVTVCPAGHQAPMSALFCPECGRAPGPARLATLVGRGCRPGIPPQRLDAGPDPGPTYRRPPSRTARPRDT
jgi:hypothetical protein